MDKDDFNVISNFASLAMSDAVTSLGMTQEEYEKVVNECIFGDDIERKEG